MIIESSLTVTRQLWTMVAGEPDYWRFVKQQHMLDYIETEYLDVETTHRLSNNDIRIVYWRPIATFANPMEYAQFVENFRREPFLHDGYRRER